MARDTIVNVYSTTKTMTALTALLIADRGELDFAEPVAKYWPEFAANGKAAVTVAQLMSHSAGLSGWKEPISKADLYDWDKVTSLLAAQAPYWPPGAACGYHALTQGYLVGEVVRRITGKTLGTVFREEIAAPLGADFWIGLPASEDARVAQLIPPAAGTSVGAGKQTELQANMTDNPGIDVSETYTRAWRGAEIPAAGGTGNARSVAEIHTILANGGVSRGKRFLSEKGCRKALELQIAGDDLILGLPARYGLGFGLAGGLVPLPNANSMYWGGYGGSIIIIDMDARATFSYVMNKMQGTTTVMCAASPWSRRCGRHWRASDIRHSRRTQCDPESRAKAQLCRPSIPGSRYREPRNDEVLAACASASIFPLSLRDEAMSDAVGPGDLVLCVNAAPNHMTGEAVPLVAGETYVVGAVMEFACPCGRSDALLDIGIDFAWCQSRFRLLPKPKFNAEPRAREVSKPKETVR